MEGFKNSEEFAGLLQSAKVLDVKLEISDAGWIVMEKQRKDQYSSNQILPDWKVFDKHFWVPIILKKMNLL